MFCKYFIIILNILLKFKVNGLLCNQILLNEKRAELPMGFKNNARLGISISLCILMQYPCRQNCLYCQAISVKTIVFVLTCNIHLDNIVCNLWIIHEDNSVCIVMQYPCKQYCLYCYEISMKTLVFVLS